MNEMFYFINFFIFFAYNNINYICLSCNFKPFDCGDWGLGQSPIPNPQSPNDVIPYDKSNFNYI